MGLGRQGKEKARKRAVDMSPTPEELAVADMWSRPPQDECEQEIWTSTLPGASAGQEQLKIRIVRSRFTWETVEFAIVHRTKHRGRWYDVVEVDSCHDVDVHLHRYARSTSARVGDPEVLAPITCLEDVQKGYELAFDRLEQSWEAHKKRWHSG